MCETWTFFKTPDADGGVVEHAVDEFGLRLPVPVPFVGRHVDDCTGAPAPECGGIDVAALPVPAGIDGPPHFSANYTAQSFSLL